MRVNRKLKGMATQNYFFITSAFYFSITICKWEQSYINIVLNFARIINARKLNSERRNIRVYSLVTVCGPFCQTWYSLLSHFIISVSNALEEDFFELKWDTHEELFMQLRFIDSSTAEILKQWATRSRVLAINCWTSN